MYFKVFKVKFTFCSQFVLIVAFNFIFVHTYVYDLDYMILPYTVSLVLNIFLEHSSGAVTVTVDEYTVCCYQRKPWESK